MPASTLVRLSTLPLLLGLAVTTGGPPALQAQEADEVPVHQTDDPVLRPYVWRSIGPIGQGGRVDDFAVAPGNPHTYFVGFATPDSGRPPTMA